MEHKKGFNFLKTYLLIGALAGVFGTLIGYGTLIYSGLSYVIISDDEYVASDRYYEVQRCEEPVYMGKENPTPKTEKEIEECKVGAEERTLLQRKTEFKKDLIGGIVWGTLFLLILLFHYPKFMKANKED